MSHTVVAIDLGASSGRVMRGVLENGVLSIEECSRFPNRPVHVPREGGDDLQWDILSLWRGIRSGLREAALRGPVDAVGIDTWGVDYARLDNNGRLIGNPFAYRSDRTTTAVEELNALRSAQWYYERNGSQFQPFNTIYQLVTDQDGGQTETTETVLLLPDLLGYWLTGKRYSEVTNASTTGLLDPQTRQWNTDIIKLLADEFDLPGERILPDLVEPGTVIGPVRLSRADLLTQDGVRTPLVAVGSHDTASAVAAVPATPAPGEQVAFISCGTWSLLGLELDHPVTSPASHQANFTNELGIDGTVRYLKNIMGMWVQQEVLRQWKEEGAKEDPWSVLNEETTNAEAFRSVFDINNPEFLAPGSMVQRIEAYLKKSDEPLPRTRGEYLRTITESLVIAYRRALQETLELSGSRISSLHLVGGGSKSALLCQLTADATGIPVIAGPDEGTAIGNMIVQLRAVGALSGNLTELRATVTNSVETFRYEPTPGAQSDWEAAERRALFN